VSPASSVAFFWWWQGPVNQNPFALEKPWEKALSACHGGREKPELSKMIGGAVIFLDYSSQIIRLNGVRAS